ncbi:MAG: hypothetical protein QOJ42_1383, partial [Acidobacteriaceae bacterium]|nr:hypothetical protein [Acidobacteriaceae bacterium]
MRRVHRLPLPVASLIVVLLSGCVVGPKYNRPSTP